MEQRNIRIAITHGDTNGTGYEVIFKAFENPTMFELCTPVVYGSPKVAGYHKKALGTDVACHICSGAGDIKDGCLNLMTCFDEETKVDLGTPTPESAAAAQKAVQRALADVQEGMVDALVCLPFQDFSHSAFIQKTLQLPTRPMRVSLNETICLALITTHVAIKDVAEAITKQIIMEKATLLHSTLCRDLNITGPRIAVLALNPVGSEDGEEFGEEEREHVKPAIDELAQNGIQAFGPYATDTFFGARLYENFDGVLAMYHDQGVAPLRTLAPQGGATILAGLPFVCLLPDLSPRYDCAGKGVADAQPLRDAVYHAIDIVRNRQSFDEARANPLPKLYHERREDGDKARFSVGRKKRDDAQPKEKE